MEGNNIQHPKVTVIGAGSLFFGRQAIWQMVHSEHLNKGTLSFVDTDETRLKKMVNLAQMVARANKTKLKIEGSTDRRDVLFGSDYVVLSFAKDSVKYRGIDCEISEKFGVRMCSGDTIGPGGIFRAMREFPVILDCLSDIRRSCPDALVINYINPTAVHGLGIKRYAPDIKSFALCDGLHMPHVKQRYAIRAGLIHNKAEYTNEFAQRFDLKIAGVNHFTWLLKAEYDGVDMTDKIALSLSLDAAKETDGGDGGAKAAFNDSISYELYKIYGLIPTCVGHTKEYLRFWQGHGTTKDRIPPLTLWETEARYIRHREMWDQVDSFIEGRRDIMEFMTELGPDHATDIIENIEGGLGKQFFINTYNNGAVPNMSNDAFLELLCDVSKEGINPVNTQEMPRGIRGMQELVLDTHELTAEAIYERSFEKLRRAMMTDPLVCSISDADNIIRELMDKEKEVLPKYWFDA